MNEDVACMTDIRVVLFDFGGVLAEEGFREGLYVIAEQHGLDPDAFYQAAQDAVYDSGFVLGRGEEADFWQLLRERFPLAMSDAALTQTILQRFVLRPPMLDAVRALRAAGIRCGILSDQTDWLERLDARHQFYELFDQVYNSYRLGKGKRDPSLFDQVVVDLGVRAEQVLFLDDNPGNVARAQARGLQAVCCADVVGCLAALSGPLGQVPPREADIT